MIDINGTQDNLCQYNFVIKTSLKSIAMFGNYEELEKLKVSKKKLESKVRSIEDDLKKGLNRRRHEQAVQLENYEVLLELLRITENNLNDINKKIYQLENAVN